MQGLQERLAENRKKKRRSFLKKLFCVVALFASLGFAWHYVHRPDVAFGDVTVKGTNLFPRRKILHLSETAEPLNLFRISRSKLLCAIKEDVHVKKAEASYKWPGVLAIEVEERKPALYIKSGYSDFAKCDSTGLVLDMSDGIKDSSVPLLSGMDCGNIFIGDEISSPDIKSILNFWNGLSAEAKAAVSELIVKDGHLSVRMRSGFPVKLGPLNELAGKDDLFMTVFNELKGKDVRAEYIDLEYSKPYVKMSAEK